MFSTNPVFTCHLRRTSPPGVAPPSSIDPNASGSELGEYPGSTEIPATATAPCCTRRKTDRALPLKPFRSCFRTLTFCQFYHNSSPTLCYLVRLGARVPFISSIFAHRNSQLKTSRIHLPIPGHAMGCYGLVKAAPKFDDISLWHPPQASSAFLLSAVFRVADLTRSSKQNTNCKWCVAKNCRTQSTTCHNLSQLVTASKTHCSALQSHPSQMRRPRKKTGPKMTTDFPQWLWLDLHPHRDRPSLRLQRLLVVLLALQQTCHEQDVDQGVDIVFNHPK